MPLIVLSLLLQVACAVHVVRSGRPHYWIYVVLIGSFLGVAIYVFAEVVPNLHRDPVARRVVQDVRQKIDPEHGKRRAARQLDIADTLENRRRLAEQSMASGDYQQALELYRNSLSGMYRTDPTLMLGLAQAQFALDLPGEARATLEALIAANPTYRSSEGHLLYARAVEASGDLDKALEEYEAVVQDFTGEEARVRYAQLLQRRGQGGRAAAVFEQVVKRASLAPKYYQRNQRAWVDIAKRALQEHA